MPWTTSSPGMAALASICLSLLRAAEARAVLRNENMTTLGIAQIAAYFLVVLALTKPLGAFMARLFQGSGRSSIRCCARSNA